MERHVVEVEIFLGIGDYHATTRATKVSTLLGSCISVTMHHPPRGFGAICHASLPAAPTGQAVDFRYVDYVIPVMIGWFERHKIPRRELVVKLFGGADMYGRAREPGGLVTVGRKNVVMARTVLGEEGLDLAASDVGGHRGRKLLFHTATGEVLVSKNTSRDIGQ
jgi:chemotaxis protein CheD